MASTTEAAVANQDDSAVWIWDPDRRRIIWANEIGVGFWGERSLLDLIERDFGPHEAASRDFADLLEAATGSETGKVRARLVLTPQGAPVRVEGRAAKVALPDGRSGLRVRMRRAQGGPGAELDRLREVIERAPIAISLFADDGALLTQNAAAAQSFGAPELETVALRYGDRNAARTALRALLVNGSHSHTAELDTRFGRRAHRVVMRRMHDPVSGGLAALVFFTDIADRAPSLIMTTGANKAAESALLSSMEAGAAVFDDALKPLFLSETARHLLGAPSGAGSFSLGATFPRERQRIADALTAIRDGRSDRAEIRLAAEGDDDAMRWLRMDIRRGAWRGAAAWVATVTDVTTDRRAALSARRESDERERALDALGVGAASLAPDGVIEAITEAGAELFGADRDALIGKPLADFLDEDAAEALERVLNQSEEPETLVAQRLGAGGGLPAPLRIAVGAPGKRGGARAAVFAELQRGGLGRADAGLARSEAIARTSHELRTPLNAILGFTQIMLDDPEPIHDESYVQYLRDIYESGLYMTRLVQDLLDLRRIEAGALSLTPGPVNIANLVRKIARDLEPAAKKREVSVTLSLQEDMPSIEADAHTMRQALTNLMGNAVKFTSSPGWVRVAATMRSSGALQIDVIDNGPGLTPEEMEVALKPFGQDPTLAREFGGAGMGLPLARGFVQANGGRFDMVSEKGVGATARIIIPQKLVGETS